MRELLRRVTAEELQEWEAYSQLEPFGPPAEFWQAGIIASTLANLHRKKGKKPFKPEDFMPRVFGRRRKREQTPEQMLAHLKALGGMTRV